VGRAATCDAHVLYLTILGDHPHEDLDALALLALQREWFSKVNDSRDCFYGTCTLDVKND
jgi:hypothetical protein